MSVRSKSSGRAGGRGLTAKPLPKSASNSLFQKSCKSHGNRGYSAHLKELPNGNHLLVLTDAKCDPQTGQTKKSRLYVHGEDFLTFFRMLHETAGFIRNHPVPEDIRRQRERYWHRKHRRSAAASESLDE
jgi:hypothetical protein